MVAWFARSVDPSGIQPPILQLDGPRLARSFETLVGASEGEGGVERYITAIAFKASLFQETLAPERIGALTEDTFLGLCAFMAPVRRRIGPWLKDAGSPPPTGWWRGFSMAPRAAPAAPMSGWRRFAPASPTANPTAGYAIWGPSFSTTPCPSTIR